MKRAIDVEAMLSPIPGENPGGEDLRYHRIYEEIKEARRADDALDRGDWQIQAKSSDWEKVISLSTSALAGRTKDLQIAAWLAEALVRTEGFSGLAAALELISGMIVNFWDHLYPPVEDDDLEFRAGPLEFLNERLWISVKEIPLTDRSVTPGHSWLRWQESRQVGYEADTRDRYGEVIEDKRAARREHIAEGKLTAEEFDSAVALSPRAFYESLSAEISLCAERFSKLDELVDQKFGKSAPRLAELRESLEECRLLAARILKEKREREPAPEPEPAAAKKPVEIHANEPSGPVAEEPRARAEQGVAVAAAPVVFAAGFPDSGQSERALWAEALRVMNDAGMKTALELLLGVSQSAPSTRDRCRCRLLMARLCLEAGRADLARPIVEELHALIEELHLERWESPIWIAEVLESLYRCLTWGTPSDSDMERASDLFRRICTADVTKAMIYRS